MTALRVMIGPTAAGKSGLAMAMAQHRDLAIVSADSRQVYRHFDIGTAKPTADEQRTVLHYGIDVVDPEERYSARRWASDAEGWCVAARDGAREPLLVGGTGFYVRALVSPLDAVPELDIPRRELLAQWLDAMDSATLARWCERLDPARASLGRTQRLRAVETALLAGRRLGDALHGGSEAGQRSVRYLVVDPGAVLASRIESRVHAMMAGGWLDEVRALRARFPDSAPAWKASGYEALRASLDSGAGAGSANASVVERVIIETRQYAKRQRTWFRHQLTEGPVTNIDPTQPDALGRALAWWDGNEEEE